jgi:hypothetical protein
MGCGLSLGKRWLHTGGHKSQQQGQQYKRAYGWDQSARHFLSPLLLTGEVPVKLWVNNRASECRSGFQRKNHSTMATVNYGQTLLPGIAHRHYRVQNQTLILQVVWKYSEGRHKRRGLCRFADIVIEELNTQPLQAYHGYRHGCGIESVIVSSTCFACVRCPGHLSCAFSSLGQAMTLLNL